MSWLCFILEQSKAKSALSTFHAGVSLPTRQLRFVLSLLLYLSLSSEYAQAQKPSYIPQAKAFPSAYDLYPSDDPYRELKIAAEEEMGLYLVEPPRRHASEITNYNQHDLHFHIWRPISEGQRAMWSRGLDWLLFGRIKYSGGAQQLFADLPNLKRITLSFHEVIRPDKKGRRRSSKPDKIVIYLTLSITREDFERVNLEAIKRCSRHLDCDDEIRSMISLVKFNAQYIRRRLK